jgi:hypothetical protein
MPTPQLRPTRTVNGETREWDGSQWVPSGGAAAPALPMANVPRGTFTPEQVKSNVDQGNWLLKNLLMTGGMIAGGAATGGVAPMIAGAALGRMAGHVPEAEVARFRGDDPSNYSVGSYLDEGAQGAMEGAAGEAQSRAVGPALKYGGRGLKVVGRMLGDDPTAETWKRAGIASTRAWLANQMGGHGWGLAAGIGPPIASELGKRAERAGTAMMTRPGLAEGLGGAWEALKERLRPAASHADRLAAGAEDALARKTAPWRVPERYPKAGPTGGDPHVNPFGADMGGPPTAPTPEPLAIDRLAGERPLTDYSRQEWTRGGPAPGPSTGPTVGTTPSTGTPPEWGPLGRPPDVDTTTPTVKQEGFAGEPPPRENVTYNPQGVVMGTTEQPPWLDQYAIDPSEYRTPSPAGSADALVNRVRRTPQGFDVDLTGPNIIGGPEASAPAAPPKAGVPSPPAAPAETGDLPANLTPDELVKYYEGNYPSKGSGSAQNLLDKIRTPRPTEAAGSFAKKFGLPSEMDVATNVAEKNAAYDAQKQMKDLVDAVESGSADFSDVNTPEATANFLALQKRLGQSGIK